MAITDGTAGSGLPSGTRAAIGGRPITTRDAAYLDDGPGSRTVRACIKDKDEGSTCYTTTITITNVAPTATLANGGAVQEGSTGTVSFQ